MSLGIAFKGPEGIVLAADSRVTLTVQLQPGGMLLPATFDNATKLLRVSGHDYVGAVTYGLGAIGEREPRTAHSYIPELEGELANAGRLPVAEFAGRLSDFFMRQWQAHMPAEYEGPPMIFVVGGYDEGAPYGRLFEFFIPIKPTPLEQHAGQGNFGMVWGGQREFIDRLIQGFDDRLPSIVQQCLNIPDDKRGELREHLRGQLLARIPFAFLPLQDCVDLSIFLVRTTIAIQNWIVGVRGVGGAIDVATITRVEGFRAVQQKSVVGERSRDISGTR